MAITVPNVEVLYPADRHTKVPRIVPLYEVPLLQHAAGGREVEGPREVPGPRNARTHLQKVGRKTVQSRDRYKGIRVTEFEDLREEEARLRAKYSFFEEVFPTSAAFVAHARTCYEEELGHLQIRAAIVAKAEGDEIEDDEQEVASDEEAPVAEPAASDDFAEEGPDVSALEALPYIDRDDAIELFNGGITDLEAVVNAAPGRIGELIDGVGPAREKQIRDAASDALFAQE